MCNYTLKIDTREKHRSKQAIDYFHRKKECKDIFIEQMEVGDYVFIGEDGVTVGFEYKTAEDLLNSINNHRVFDEVYRLNEKYDYSFLIVEANYQYAIKNIYFNTKISYNRSNILGAYRRVRCFCPIIEVVNPSKKDKSKKDNRLMYFAFEDMHEQSIKCLDGKSDYYRVVKAKKHRNPCLTILCTLSNINFKTANKIVKHLQLNSIEELFDLNVEQLMLVDGIGEKKANAIIKQIKGGL